MSAFNCTSCGALMQSPPSGSTAICPKCGQMFEMPSAPPPSSRSRRDEYWDEPEADDRYGRRGRLRHSGLGIASFIIGAIAVVLILLMILVAAAMAGKRPSRNAEETMEFMAGLFVCTGLVASLVGLGLGLAGVLQADRNRVFAVIGLVLNGLLLLGAAGLILIGAIVSTGF